MIMKSIKTRPYIPERLEIEEITPNHIRLYAYPFEPHYAITVAHPVRRLLLSSTVGYAPIAIKESGVSSGVRRIEAVCGKAGYEYSKTALHTISQAKESLKTQDILHGIQKLKTQITESKASQATHIDIKKLESQIINDTMLIVTQISEGNIKDIIDKVKNTYKSVAILLLQDDNKGRITLAAGVKNVSLKAGEWIKEVAQILGGNGGGRDDFATAGGKDSTKIHKALTHAIQKAKDSIN